MTDITTPATSNDPQAEHNARVWANGRFVGFYASHELRPAESVFIDRYREDLKGKVLELGCGAGRLTGHLIEVADSVHGIDLSPRMVEHCRKEYPRGTYSVLDLRDVARFGPGYADAVIATYSVIDVLGDEERRRVLADIATILKPGGLLMMSSHNLAYVPKLRSPTDLRARNIVRRAGRLALMPFRLRNRLALTRFERKGEGWAIVNDDAHTYRLVHYYISRDAQERQLREEGFELIECLDNDGRTVGPGETGEDYVELYYIARPIPAAGP